MKRSARVSRRYGSWMALAMGAVLCALFAVHFVLGQARADFPDGFDAVQAAPKSHRVVFENPFVRVLEVSVVAGQTVPMHHHRWPSLVVNWDTGGKSPHVRYHAGDGTVKDIPSTDNPTHAGRWEVHWMNPEPMHSIDVLEAPVPDSSLRIEIKCGS